MRYVFPVIIFFIAWNISAAIALYLATSNIFMIGQELYVKKDVETEKNEKRRNN
jgi:YidC/Oxa1 family membrane protein insertase